MTIDDINAQLKLKNTELQITSETNKRQTIQKQIKVLLYKREIEEIKAKIQAIC